MSVGTVNFKDGFRRNAFALSDGQRVRVIINSKNGSQTLSAGKHPAADVFFANKWPQAVAHPTPPRHFTFIESIIEMGNICFKILAAE